MMGSVAILCKLRNCNAYSGMEHWGGLQHTIHSKGGSGELHKGGGKGKLPTGFDVRDCRSCPQRKGSCKGDPLAKNKQRQCLCETSAEGAASASPELRFGDVVAAAPVPESSRHESCEVRHGPH